MSNARSVEIRSRNALARAWAHERGVPLPYNFDPDDPRAPRDAELYAWAGDLPDRRLLAFRGVGRHAVALVRGRAARPAPTCPTCGRVL